MKDLAHDDAKLAADAGPVRVSLFTRLMARIAGVSLEQLQFVPDTERGSVNLVGLGLLLVMSASALGWWMALGIARGHYSIAHLPFAILAGGLVLIIDRAMLRQHWYRHGKIKAQQRGFDVPDARSGLLAMTIQWSLRVVVSLILSLTVSGFLGLALFEGAITAHIAAQTRAANLPLYKAAEQRYDATVSALKAEAGQLDKQIQAILANQAAATAVAQAAARKQISALSTERAGLQARVSGLSDKLDCSAVNKIAEANGGVRCDATRAVSGRGKQWAAASALVALYTSEKKQAEGRISKIDAELAQLRVVPAQHDASAEARLSTLTALRATKVTRLTALNHGRDQAVRAAVMADLRYVPVPKGLIVRGEALDDLTHKSPWLAMRIWLVVASITILDLAAVIVLTLLPPPLGLSVGEALASEAAAHQRIARFERSAGAARQDALRSREAAMAAQAEVESRMSKHEVAMATRRHMADHLDDAIRRACENPMRQGENIPPVHRPDGLPAPEGD